MNFIMIQKYFERITDKRQEWKTKHNLLEIIVMTICAVVAECEAWYQIEEYCEEKESWFKEKLGLKLENGIPSHDTFERVFAMIDPKEMENCFMSWIRAVKQHTNGEIVSIDGKTICASREDNKRAIHMVSAWANANKVVLGQVRINEKSNEITAIPALIEMLALKGCIVTIDAMGCQKEIAQKISDKEAEYVLSLKGNQSSLNDDVVRYFETAIKERQFYPDIEDKTTQDNGHGRIEKRKYYLTNDIEWLNQKRDWKNLRSIGMVKSIIKENGEKREESRYFITSLTDIETFSKAVRSHWGIENGLHWVLDVAFNEDRCRMRKDNSGENFAVIRHIALNLLKQDDSKLSIKAKRHKCAYSDRFLYKILFENDMM